MERPKRMGENQALQGMVLGGHRWQLLLHLWYNYGHFPRIIHSWLCRGLYWNWCFLYLEFHHKVPLQH